uniref:CCDC174 alpha/beta GRSR domain-containing protein n=1 Tax=Cuerna arida TaxID=1464854 RepID=A0A1B6G1S0_9HEMI
MDPTKAIDIEISKSSLIGLKAELLKKQEEVRKIRELQQNNCKPVLKPKKATETQKSNKGVEGRSLKDVESVEDDFDIHKKSREVLEAKSRLYDKLKESCFDPDSKSQYLTDFNLKHEIYDKKKETACNKNEEIRKQSDDEEDHFSDTNSDSDNDWVDFVDALGRTRRCLKQDLGEMKAKDSKLAKSLRPPTPPPVPEATPELMSWDMQREQMRKKWEEQETVLLGKKDVHYQDILFDEARPHGVGYFEFSIDENERLRQQQALKNLRNETVEQQQAAEGLRVRRQQQLQARLAAARRRKRERLGLPPEDPQPQEIEEVTASNTVGEECQKEDEVKVLEESIKRQAAVRPWDIGKESINRVMSQEEWIEKKRLERPEEFAPPISHVKVADEKKHFTFNSTLNKPPKMTKSSRINKGKSIDHPKNSDNLIVNMSSGSSCEDIKGTSCQSDSADNILHSTQNNMSDTKARDWKKTSDEIDAFLAKVRANSSNSADQDYKNNEANTPGTVCIDSTVRDPERRQAHSTNESFEYSDNAHNLSKETTFSRNTTTFIKHSILPNTNKKHSNIISDEFPKSTDSSQHSIAKRKWAEIAPPASMSYYTSNIGNKQSNTVNSPQLADSISVGLNYLKTQTKEKEKKRLKGLLDII